MCDRYLDALFHTIDGNFHQNQRMKPSDPADKALSLGAGYFANDDDFKAFQKTLGPLEPEVCPAVVRLGASLKLAYSPAHATNLERWATVDTGGTCRGR